MQLDLFKSNKAPMATMLQRAASNGRLFYTVRQTAEMLHLSGFRVYYLVYNYRLDALWIAGEYRIPFTAIIDYVADRSEISRQFFDYIAYTDNRTLSGVLPFHNECGPAPTHPDGTPAGKHLMDAIRQRQWPERSLSREEADPIDWYCLTDLRAPYEAPVNVWAQFLSVTVEQLVSDSDWSSAEQIVEWPEMYDWMIEREVVNLPVPYRYVTPKKDAVQSRDRAQLLLEL